MNNKLLDLQICERAGKGFISPKNPPKTWVWSDKLIREQTGQSDPECNLSLQFPPLRLRIPPRFPKFCEENEGAWGRVRPSIRVEQRSAAPTVVSKLSRRCIGSMQGVDGVSFIHTAHAVQVES